MGKRIEKLEFVVIAVLFLTGVYFWSLPYQENHFPYGETDASAHFSVADYMGQNDIVSFRLPNYLIDRYGKENVVVNGDMWYPPQYHTNLAIMQVLSGDRFRGVFLFNTIMCLLLPISIYFLLRKLFNFYSAVCGSFLYLFAVRDIQTYLWGQWPTLVMYSYLFVLVYLYYKFIYLKDENKVLARVYFYIFVVLFAFQYLIHPLGMIITPIILTIFSIFMMIKKKSIFAVEYKTIFIGVGVFIILIIALAWSQTLSIFMFSLDKGQNYYDIEPIAEDFVKKLFSWYHLPTNDAGYPEQYYDFFYNHYSGILVLICFVFSFMFLLYRREQRDILMLSLVVSLYVLFHLYVFGIRFAFELRIFSLETSILYSIAALSIYFAYKTEILKKNYFHSLIVFVFIVFIVLSAINSYPLLKNAYGSIVRVTNPQYEAAMFIKENVRGDDVVYEAGILSLAKMTWVRGIAQKRFSDKPDLKSSNGQEMIPNYVMIDYSDYLAIGNRNALDSLNALEEQVKNNSKKIYDKNNIRVYKIEN